MSDYDTASLLHEQNRLLAKIVEQTAPVKTLEQARERLTETEFRHLVLERIVSAPLGSVVNAVADSRGFDSVAAMLEFDQREKDRLASEKAQGTLCAPRSN